jgi:hypothetical protein
MKRSIVAALVILFVATSADAADVFLRFRVTEPPGEKFHATVSGWRHEDPWYLPSVSADVAGGAWSEWLDLTKWPLHARLDRAGGIAEWPAARIAVERAKGCTLEAQLADRADAAAVVHSFTEKTGSDTIAFLLPTPLREHAKEFETGSQMAARHLAWAKVASGEKPARLKDFTLITALWGHYDPTLAASEVETLRLLGFNVIGGVDPKLLKPHGIRRYQTAWVWQPVPAEMEKAWKSTADALKGRDESEVAHWVIGDEVQTLNFVDVKGVDEWFRDYLRDHHVAAEDLGAPIDQVTYPAKAMYEKTLPRDADLPTRRLLYHAAKFGQWWSARMLRRNSDLIRASFPGVPTETLPSDHGFLNAWGPPHIGMSYRMLDLFELGSQRVVDPLSAEDWLGLNHMYGPAYTWTGAQTFAYFTAICRSAVQSAKPPIVLRGLITPSDDAYLRLKAYSAIGQGARSFFFWTYGPTYIGTENYWSDLRSEYDGIAKLSRAIEQAEPVLMQAKRIHDPVAILYSVSHDIWHTDDPAAFAEKRLLWHALRHLHVQPDFLREEDVEAGKLKHYAALYVTDACVSRAASAKIDQWVKSGGIVQLHAGAATRDEFYEPFVPAYAASVWPADAAKQLQKESHQYNERVDLPTIKPMASVSLNVPRGRFELPALGQRMRLKDGVDGTVATFADGSPAGAITSYGRGKVIAMGFLPMLAYGQGAQFAPTQLKEQWPGQSQEVARLALDAAMIGPEARADVPVVEVSFLEGDKGAAVVLVNYTYRPIRMLKVQIRTDRQFTRAVSTEGHSVDFRPSRGGAELRLPLAWTDIILLE